jgi:TonB family protein
MRVRTMAVIAAFLCLSMAALAQTQGLVAAQSSPTPPQVIDGTSKHMGAAVSWVVRFKTLVRGLDRNGMSADQMLFEWRDSTGRWTEFTVITPPAQQVQYASEAAAQRDEQMYLAEPRLMSGTVRGIRKAHTSALETVSVVLDDVKLDLIGPQTPIPTPAQEPYTPGKESGVSWPKVVKEEKPAYPMDAAKKLQGAVELEIVVATDGTVSSVKVTKSLDDGKEFDKAAIASAKKWVFQPGLKDGKPVPTRVALVLEFRYGR